MVRKESTPQHVKDRARQLYQAGVRNPDFNARLRKLFDGQTAPKNPIPTDDGSDGYVGGDYPSTDVPVQLVVEENDNPRLEKLRALAHDHGKAIVITTSAGVVGLVVTIGAGFAINHLIHKHAEPNKEPCGKTAGY